MAAIHPTPGPGPVEASGPAGVSVATVVGVAEVVGVVAPRLPVAGATVVVGAGGLVVGVVVGAAVVAVVVGGAPWPWNVMSPLALSLASSPKVSVQVSPMACWAAVGGHG